MPADAPTPEGPFTTCPFCGEANPPGLKKCRICGQNGLLTTGAPVTLPKRQRRWYYLVRYGRIAVVAAVAIGLGVLMLQAALTPAPIAADPLTQSSTLTAPAGSYVELSGAITGGDYIQGNYTVTNVPGALLTLLIYNDSQWSQFLQGYTPASQEPMSPSASNAFVFSAPYTDTFHFVWVNHYPTVSGLNLQFYDKTEYEPNTVIA